MHVRAKKALAKKREKQEKEKEKERALPRAGREKEETVERGAKAAGQTVSVWSSAGQGRIGGVGPGLLEPTSAALPAVATATPVLLVRGLVLSPVVVVLLPETARTGDRQPSTLSSLSFSRGD